MRRVHLGIFIFGLFTLVGSLGYFGYTAWRVYYGTHFGISTELSAAQIEENKNKLTEAFVHAGVSYLDITRGFWMRTRGADGLEQVRFLSVDDLAKRGLTEWQIRELMETLAGSETTSRDSMRAVPLDELPDTYQFHNSLYDSARSGQSVAMREALEQQVRDGSYSAKTLFELGYLYELEAKYDDRDALYTRACKEFGERCDRGLTVHVRGRVTNRDGVPLSGVRVTALGVPNEPTVETSDDGTYTLTLAVQEMEKMRIRASKRGYSDGTVSSVVVTTGRTTYSMEDIVLATPLAMVTVNTDMQRIITGQGRVSEAGEFVVSSGFVTYYIPGTAIVHKDGSAYRGDVEIIMYEFSKANAPDSLLAADILSRDLGYSGDLMVTYGMPYIQFITPTGEELHVMKSHPMRLVQKMAEIDRERLESNEGGVASKALTERDMKALVNASLFGDFALTYDYLATHHLDTFPAYWVFDRTAGVWDNVGMNVLDMEGTVEAHFYTINDQR